MRVDGREFVLADIPGLIEGAHEGHGLGDRFLGHVERCGALIHLVDATGDDPAGAYRTVRKELAAYGADLAAKPEIVALSKIDAVDHGPLPAMRAKLLRAMRSHGPAPAEGAKRTLIELSAATQQGVQDVLRATLTAIDAREKRAEAVGTAHFPLVRPRVATADDEDDAW